MRYAAAVRRRDGGAILAVMDADSMLAFQKSVGAVDLVDAVGATGGIAAADPGGRRGPGDRLHG